jgi:regulator of sirC expression with transglutaminase-like and TPR domain
VDPTTAFVELVRRRDESIPLARGAMLIAAHAYPGLDVEAELAVIEDLATGCPEADLDGWHRHFFVELAFSGNAVDYHDPRNSFLNDVVRRRLGIPISLAVVAMEVSRRVGLHLTGIGMPGHFLLHHEGLPPVFIDPFDGRFLDERGCEERFRASHGTGVAFSSSFLAPVGPRAILGRMLANLQRAFLRAQDVDAAVWAMRLRLAIPGAAQSARADLAEVLARAGRFREAAQELETLAETEPGRAEQLVGQARQLRARLN